jgi:hypothetical protein
MGSALNTAGFHAELAPMRFGFLSSRSTAEYTSGTANLYRPHIVYRSRPFLSSLTKRFRHSLLQGLASRLIYSTSSDFHTTALSQTTGISSAVTQMLGSRWVITSEWKLKELRGEVTRQVRNASYCIRNPFDSVVDCSTGRIDESTWTA